MLNAKYLVHVQYTQERSRENEEELIRLVYNVMSTLKKDRYIDQVAKLFSLLLEGRHCKQILLLVQYGAGKLFLSLTVNS